MRDTRDPDYIFKILMLGDGSVGKTSLSKHYIERAFTPDIRLTVGIQFFIKQEIKVEDKRVKLQIWDFGGEDRFRIMVPTLCLGSHGCIFMYDVTRPSTLNSHHSWTYIVKERCGKDVPIMLVGNKIDLVEKRAISTEHGIEVAKRSGFTGFSETSAKDGTNVDSTFETIARLMVQRMHRLEKEDQSKDKKSTVIVGK
ncbi:MAG: GTP-binding protein [Candidatus Lokiarchaeota archaeon]|nr:GTP-binding protein [Candidatus Lokiarchaeota archaeon]